MKIVQKKTVSATKSKVYPCDKLSLTKYNKV